MKVFLLADIPGWIVDRCVDRMIAGMPEITFRKGYYACLTTGEIIEQARDCDLIHYGNWDIECHWPRLLDAGKPVLMSVRSHRFPPYVREVAKRVNVHVVNRGLLGEFPGATYIPDGLMLGPEPLRVGFAGRPGAYKGSDMIEQACREIGAVYCPATDLDSQRMSGWYRAVDVIVCASQAEGFSTIVMEALALNKPVVSVRAGAPWFERLPGVTWVDRTAEGIKSGLLQHWPARRLEPFTWPTVCAQFRDLYGRLA